MCHAMSVLGKILSPVATTAESLYVFPFRGHFHSTSQNTVTIYCFNEGNRVCISSSCPVISGIARCFTFGGSRKRVLHDPAIKPRSDLSKEQYMKKEEQTTVNHFHEKLLKLKDLMKTKVNTWSLKRTIISFRHMHSCKFVGALTLCLHNTCL